MFDDTPIQNPLEHGPLTPEQHPVGTRLLCEDANGYLYEITILEWAGTDCVKIQGRTQWRWERANKAIVGRIVRTLASNEGGALLAEGHVSRSEEHTDGGAGVKPISPELAALATFLHGR